ncbi:MAG: FecCD family ABC transporter permease, partial [Acidimicrobiales bacterium]
MTASTASESVDAGSRRARAVGRDMVVRGRWWSARLDARPIVVTAALALGLVAVASLSISLGDFPIPLSEVIATRFGGGDDEAVFVVGTLRLPRVITGSLVGLALGMSGVMFQSLLRNPLASPDVIGFNSGAALGAVMVIVTWGGSSAQIALGAIAGGLGAAFAVYALAWRRGVGVYRLVLVGIGIGFTINAVVQYLLTRASINDVQRAAVWLTGSLNGRTWSHAGSITTALVVLVPIALGLQRRLDLLALGDDTAAALGVEMNRTKLAL